VTDSAVYLTAALMGAVVGGLISLSVSAQSARRERRARYGESLLATLTNAHRRLATAVAMVEESSALPGRVVLRDEAIAIWTQGELAATLEWSASGRRAMRDWATDFYELLSRGAGEVRELQSLDRQLDLGVYIVIAWTARHARGRDFRRPGSEIERLFGPR
jgi:hypothetical protein